MLLLPLNERRQLVWLEVPVQLGVVLGVHLFQDFQLLSGLYLCFAVFCSIIMLQLIFELHDFTSCLDLVIFHNVHGEKLHLELMASGAAERFPVTRATHFLFALGLHEVLRLVIHVHQLTGMNDLEQHVHAYR